MYEARKKVDIKENTTNRYIHTAQRQRLLFWEKRQQTFIWPKQTTGTHSSSLENENYKKLITMLLLPFFCFLFLSSPSGWFAEVRPNARIQPKNRFYDWITHNYANRRGENPRLISTYKFFRKYTCNVINKMCLNLKHWGNRLENIKWIFDKLTCKQFYRM